MIVKVRYANGETHLSGHAHDRRDPRVYGQVTLLGKITPERRGELVALVAGLRAEVVTNYNIARVARPYTTLGEV